MAAPSLARHAVSVSIAVSQSDPKCSGLKEQWFVISHDSVAQEFKQISSRQLCSVYKPREPAPFLHSPAIGDGGWARSLVKFSLTCLTPQCPSPWFLAYPLATS